MITSVEVATCDVCGQRALCDVTRPDPEAPAMVAICLTCQPTTEEDEEVQDDTLGRVDQSLAGR